MQKRPALLSSPIYQGEEKGAFEELERWARGMRAGRNGGKMRVDPGGHGWFAVLQAAADSASVFESSVLVDLPGCRPQLLHKEDSVPEQPKWSSRPRTNRFRVRGRIERKSQEPSW